MHLPNILQSGKPGLELHVTIKHTNELFFFFRVKNENIKKRNKLFDSNRAFIYVQTQSQNS